MRPAFFPGFGVLLAASLMLMGGGAPALAQPSQGVMPLDRLLPEIRRTHPGQFYDADGPSPGPDGSQHYHLKWMTPDGRIEWLDTDARTGRVLGSSPGRDSFDRPRPQAAPENRGRFRDDNGGAPANRFFPRGGPDYDNGQQNNEDRARGQGNGRDRDPGGRFRQR